MRIRAIIVSRPLLANDAVMLRHRLKDRIEGKFMFSGKYRHNGKNRKKPLYYVVWLPSKNVPWVDGHEISVKANRLLDSL